jgi:hypothetical protein
VNIKTVLLLAATLLLAQSAAIAEEKNKQWKDQDTWYQFTDKEQRGGFHTERGTSRGIPSTDTFTVPTSAPAPTSDNNEVLSVPYILQSGAADPAPATTHVETTFEPMVQPSSLAMPYWAGGVSPYFGGNGWRGNQFWGGNNFGWNAPYAHGGWRAPLGIYPSPAQLTFRPITRLVQTGPSKASGNYFNPSTPDPTASGSYYAGSGNTPKAVPVYQPEAQTKDYWGKQGSPLPPEMQPQ